MKKETKRQIMAMIILLIFGGSGIAAAFVYIFPTQQQVQNVHWHALLFIYINGENVTIPGDIGVVNGEAAPDVIHTHAGEPNMLHKEGPADLPLISFFYAWNEPFNSTCIMSYCNGAGTVKMFVSHCTDETFQTCSAPIQNYEFENYSFQNGDIIEIYYD